MTTLATIRQAMTAFLAEAGIEALSAWPKEVWKGRKTPVAVVQVKEVEAGASGFQNYLGQTYDPAAPQWTRAVWAADHGEVWGDPLQPRGGQGSQAARPCWSRWHRR